MATRHTQRDRRDGQGNPVGQQATSEEQRSTIRYDPTEKVSDRGTYVQRASAQSESPSQQSSREYVVAPGRRTEPQQASQVPSIDFYGLNSHGHQQADPFSIFTRQNVLPGTSATSAATNESSPRLESTRSDTRRDSNDRGVRDRHTQYRTPTSNDKATQEVARLRPSQGRGPAPYDKGCGPDMRPVTQRGVTGSLLSSLAQAFTQIGMLDYDRCERFMAANPSILHEQPDQLVQEAIRLAKEGRSAQAQICVQQSVLLHKCSKMSSRECQNFFDRLKAKDGKTVTEFTNDLNKTLTAVAKLAKEAGRAKPQPERSMTEISETKPLIIDERGQRRPPLESRRAPNPGPRRNSIEQVSTSFERLATGDRPNQIQGGSSEAQLGSMRPLAAANRENSGRRSMLSSSPEERVAVDSLSVTPDIRGSNDHEDREEKLDPSYKKRQDAKKFFVRGRLFAMLLHTSAGESSRGVALSDIQHSTKGIYGERIFSHIQRMAVVRERHGYCQCIPINTYGGRGVAKPGLSDNERLAHAIIYSSGQNPETLPNERGMMNKRPIAVNMTGPDQRLDRASRVHFGKTHTVEWNVKVKNIGRVSDESFPYFTGYYQLENP